MPPRPRSWRLRRAAGGRRVHLGRGHVRRGVTPWSGETVAARTRLRMACPDLGHHERGELFTAGLYVADVPLLKCWPVGTSGRDVADRYREAELRQSWPGQVPAAR